jgi:hypothetical protein
MNKQIAIIIAVALIVSAIIVGHFFYVTKKSVNTIRVVGYASGEYDSDILKWRISLSANSGANNQMIGYQSLNTDIKKFREFLTIKGFDAKNLEVTPSYNYANYNRDGNITGYIFEQTIAITISDVNRFDEIEEYAFDMSELLASSINIRSSVIDYYISKLPDIKQEIISNATKDARERALQVAQTTNTTLGKLLNGRVGVFQITEPLSTEVQSYGIYNTNTRKKQISVTMSGEFELK